ALLLQSRRARPEHQRASAPFVGRDGRREAALLADDAAQEQFEIDGRVVLDRHGWRNPFAIADGGKSRALERGRPRLGADSSRRRRARRFGPRSAPIVVLAAAIVADDTDRSGVTVDDHHGVRAIGLAGAAEIFYRVAGPVRARW